jgi:hypothetical protein
VSDSETSSTTPPASRFGPAGDVGLRKHPDEPPFLDHGHAADLTARHLLERLIEVPIGPGGHHVAGLDLAD